MRGVIFGIKRMEIHDGDGLRTTVFFKGCPLRCIWCHNPEGISFLPEGAKFADKCIGCGICGGERSESAAENCPSGALVFFGKEYEAASLADKLCEDIEFFRMSGGGVTLSGGECLAQADFASELASLLKERGVSVFVDTCGYVKRENIDKLIPYTDSFLYDIKAIDQALHTELTGRDNAIILDNLKYLVSRGAKIEMRYPLVVGKNDGECRKIAEFVKSLNSHIRVKILKYHDFSRSRYSALSIPCTLPDSKTKDEDVIKARAAFLEYGIDAFY